MTDNSPRITVVTGGADGIGWAVARRFAAGGHTVAIADIDASRAAARAGELGPAHLGLGCDVADPASVAAACERIGDSLGTPDVLVNNAGIGDVNLPTVEQDAGHFRRVLDVHLSGTFLMSRHIAAAMIATGRGGAIVNFASIAAFAGLPRRNAYGAAKAGIVAMTRNMACEWAASGIRVTAVAPGYVETELVRGLVAQGLLDPDLIRRRTPMGRLIAPEEIAEAVWFLASPAASAITGAVLTADAGWSAFGAAGDAFSAEARS